VSAWLIALTGFIYLGVCVDQFVHRNWWMGVMYFGYALANVGLYVLAKATP